MSQLLVTISEPEAVVTAEKLAGLETTYPTDSLAEMHRKWNPTTNTYVCIVYDAKHCGWDQTLQRCASDCTPVLVSECASNYDVKAMIFKRHPGLVPHIWVLGASGSLDSSIDYILGWHVCRCPASMDWAGQCDRCRWKVYTIGPEHCDVVWPYSAGYIGVCAVGWGTKKIVIDHDAKTIYITGAVPTYHTPI